MFLRLRHLWLALVLLVPGGFAASQEAQKPPVVAWQELLDHPSRYLGKSITLYAQFHGRVENWGSYLTRFGARDFSACQFWSDEQFPWVQAEYEQPRVRLFARHGQPGEAPRLAGSALSQLEMLRLLVRRGVVGLPEALCMASSTPARALGLEKELGELRVGLLADLLVLSGAELELSQAWVGGLRVF